MAESSETPSESPATNSSLITTIQPTTKLGGRGTPRRKIRRPNNNNHSAIVAARTLETKLKPFRTQFQLQDQQDFCDISILYDDGRVETQNQVHMYSTWPMTIHEIDASETGTQTYHINELDSTSAEYLFGNIDNLQNELNTSQSLPVTTNGSNYHNDIQQRQVYSQPSRYYMNYVAYQQNPYALNSYENYSNNIQQVYGGVNTQSDDEHDSTTKPSKRKRRRRNKHLKTTSEPLTSIIPEQEEVPAEHLENGNTTPIKSKRKRRRIRKSKKPLPSISEHPQTSLTPKQLERQLLSSITDENNEDLSLSLQPPTQHAEYIEKQPSLSRKNGRHGNRNASTKDVMNERKNDEKKKEKPATNFLARTADILVDDITPPTLTYIPTVIVENVDKTEDENEKITHSVINDASITTISTNNRTLDQHVSIKEIDTQQQSSSNSIQKASLTRLTDIHNRNMTDENCDPSSISTKIRPKPIDAQSVADSSTDQVQNPSTSAEISGNEILSTNKKHATVSIRDDEHPHSIASSYSSSETGDMNENIITDKEQSKMNLGEATQELTHLLHIGNENRTAGTHLNPNAPDFKPIDFSSTYRSELAPAHTQRRATHTEFYDNRNTRTRYHSETHQKPESLPSINTSTIRPLLSIVPQYTSYHRKSWTTTTAPPLSTSSSSNSWWPQEYSNTSNAASSYHSKAAYQMYTPLMEQVPLTGDKQQQHKYPAKRPRAYSGRAFVHPNQTVTTRKRSHSGPETPLPPPSTHLTGIHSLTRIMVDVLRMIHPIAEEQKETNSTEDSSKEHQDQQSNQSIEAENVLGGNQMSTAAAPSSSRSIDKTADMFDEDKILSTDLNGYQALPLISNDRNPNVKISTSEEESRKTTTTAVPGTPAARATN